MSITDTAFESYLASTTCQLEQWGDRFGRFRSSLRGRGIDDGAELLDRIEKLDRTRRRLATRIERIDGAASDRWPEVRADLEAALSDFRREAGEVYDLFQERESH